MLAGAELNPKDGRTDASTQIYVLYMPTSAAQE